MRVLHLTRDFPPRSTGGLSSAVGGLVAAVDTIEHRVVSFDDWRPRRNDTRTAGVDCAARVVRVTSEMALSSVQDFVRTCPADAVHVHDAMLWALAGESSAPKVYSVHVHHAAQDRLRGVPPTHGAQAEAAALAAATVVHAPSRAVAEALEASSHVVPLGCARVEPGTSMSPDPALVFAVGRFADMKGTDVFAEAAALAPHARWRWAGGMPANPRGDRRWRKRRLAGIELAGWLDAQQLASAYRAASVAVVPSRVETFGLAALDALRFGCPIVASDIAPLRELLGEAAVFVPVADARALAGAVDRLLDDRALRMALAQRAIVRSQAYEWPRLTADWVALYARCLRVGRPHRGQL